MISREAIEAELAIVDGLSARQDALGIGGYFLESKSGICHKSAVKWRRGERHPTLRSAIAWAHALGLEIVVRERDSTGSAATISVWPESRAR